MPLVCLHEATIKDQALSTARAVVPAAARACSDIVPRSSLTDALLAEEDRADADDLIDDDSTTPLVDCMEAVWRC